LSSLSNSEVELEMRRWNFDWCGERPRRLLDSVADLAANRGIQRFRSQILGRDSVSLSKKRKNVEWGLAWKTAACSGFAAKSKVETRFRMSIYRGHFLDAEGLFGPGGLGSSSRGTAAALAPDRLSGMSKLTYSERLASLFLGLESLELRRLLLLFYKRQKLKVYNDV